MIVRALPKFCATAYKKALSKGHAIEDRLLYFNSGSNAIKFFLSLYGPGKRVGVQVFTCPTVRDAIMTVNDTPIFLETNNEYFTTTFDLVANYIDGIDILILSHICGIPNPDYLAIKGLCKSKGVVLLDDLCQTFHARIGDMQLEDLSDNYVYSFFYDKPISATSGGGLKVSDAICTQAMEEYAKLPKEPYEVGIKNLNRLYWMSKLLHPKMYDTDFRTWCTWEIFILGCYPKVMPISILKFFVKPSISMRLSKLMKKKVTGNISRMSDVQIRYIQECMKTFENNNNLLKDFFLQKGIELPTYLKDRRISCSIAKRAIVPSKYKSIIDNGNVELGLYNWSELIDNSREYRSQMIISENINIPISTVWYK